MLVSCDTSGYETQTKPTHEREIEDAHYMIRGTLSNEITFSKAQPLGSGNSGTVYLGEMASSDGSSPPRSVAIKQLKRGNTKDNLIAEGRELSKFSGCPNIVQFIGFSVVDEEGKNCLQLITEHYAQGSLQHLCKYFLTELDLVTIARDVAVAIAQVHSRNLVHCDIAARNVFLDEELKAVLGDFQLVRAPNVVIPNHPMGNIYWMAPELADTKQCTFASDVYSFGVLLIELLSEGNQRPFVSSNKSWKLRELSNKEKAQSPALVDLMNICLNEDPSKRGTMLAHVEYLESRLHEMPK